MKTYKCDDFICSDPKSCPEWCNGLCSGKSNDGFSNCGCDACNNHRIVGPYMTCIKDAEKEYKLEYKKKHIMNYNMQTKEWTEYDEEEDSYILCP